MLYDPKWNAKPKTAEPWRDVLMRAADLIETGGHCKYRLSDEQGRHCAVGAILLIARTKKLFQTSRDRFAACLPRSHNTPIPDWNNAPERTQAEVVAALRACALAHTPPSECPST